jgi:hypothetical protein
MNLSGKGSNQGRVIRRIHIIRVFRNYRIDQISTDRMNDPSLVKTLLLRVQSQPATTHLSNCPCQYLAKIAAREKR